MNLFTANIKSNPLMRQSKVESDIRYAVRLGGIGFWQEITPKRYKAALARHANDFGVQVYCIERECPVTVRTASWVVESHEATKMHGGRFAVSPTRFTVEVRAHQRHGEHLKVAAIGTHFISAAWSRNHMLTRAWRRKMWFIHFNKLKAQVAAAHAAGYTVVMGMDANKGITSMKFHPDQIIVGHHRIDGLIVIPAKGIEVVTGPTRIIGAMYTDHDPVAVSVGLRHRPLTK